MKKRRRLITVSVVFLLISIIDFAVLRYVDIGEPGLVSGWRLFLTLVLCLLIVSGNNSARWISAILSGLATLGGIMAFAIFFLSGKLGAMPPAFLAWLGVETVAYACVAAFLVFSEGIEREIRRISEKTI